MKTINVEIKAVCPKCGRFGPSECAGEYSGDRTFATCTFCGKTYPGGEEEIREKMLEMPEVQEHLRAVAAKEAEKHIHQELKKALKGIKGLRIK